VSDVTGVDSSGAVRDAPSRNGYRAALAGRGLKPGTLLRLTGDRRLVERVEGGSERAFEALVDRHRGPLLEFCRRLLGSRDDAEDIMQQTFLVAWGEITRAQSPRSLRPWL
jgi:hypothetical protein